MSAGCDSAGLSRSETLDRGSCSGDSSVSWVCANVANDYVSAATTDDSEESKWLELQRHSGLTSGRTPADCRVDTAGRILETGATQKVSCTFTS
jgi:hypothetical protein